MSGPFIRRLDKQPIWYDERESPRQTEDFFLPDSEELESPTAEVEVFERPSKARGAKRLYIEVDSKRLAEYAGWAGRPWREYP